MSDINMDINVQTGADLNIDIDFQQGETPEINIETAPPGPKGDKGDPGINGISATHRWDGTTLIVTSASGTSSADLKGEKGNPGGPGPAGVGIASIDQTIAGLGGGAINEWEIRLTDGRKEKITLHNGGNGAPGKDGYTPVKGVDYFDGKDGLPGKDGAPGVSPAASVKKNGDEITFTVKDATGTTSVSMPNNEKVLEAANAASEKADEANAKFDGLTPEYELLGSVTLTEAVNEVLFDGLGSLKSGFLEITMEAGASDHAGYIQLRESKSVSGVSTQVTNFRRTSKRYTRFSFSKKNGFIKFFAVVPSIEYNTGSTCAALGVFKMDKNIGCVRTYLSSGELFPAGSKFELWGVKE